MILFKEVLPNPSGKDTEGEWIKIINISDETQSLTGWTLSDKGGGTFSFTRLRKEDQILIPGEEITLPYSVTKVSLNNSNETLKLINSNGEIEDTLHYTGPTSDDEIIFGKEFIPDGVVAQTGVGSINEHAFTGSLLSQESINTSPLLIALFLAVMSGIGVGFLTKQFMQEK